MRSAPLLRWLAVSCTAVVFAAAMTDAHAQAAVRVYGPGPIPQLADHGAPFASWSLFLPCNPRWLASERGPDLDRLNRAYFHFAQVSGMRHAAVWFVQPRAAAVPADRPTVAGDLERPRPPTC